MISVLWDNAGIGRFNDDYYYVITGETHNSPSNMEAYGGAITGIVGVYRDPMGTGRGSKLVMGMYGYCVGPRDYQGELRPQSSSQTSLGRSHRRGARRGQQKRHPYAVWTGLVSRGIYGEVFGCL